MFEFPRFATDDPRHAVELVRAHPFALVVTAEQSLFKLSQDIDAERRGRVQDEFRAAHNVPLAELMEGTDPA